MSLTTRMTLLVVGLMGLAGTAAGIMFYRSVRESLLTELERALDERMTWVEGALEFDGDDRELAINLDPKDTDWPWRITVCDGRTLWTSSDTLSRADDRTRSKTVVVGDAALPPFAGSELSCGKKEGESLPRDTGDKERSSGPEKSDAAARWRVFYRLPDSRHRLEIILTVGASTAPMAQELDRISGVLWTIGPALLAVSGLLLALLIRAQLKPLARMAEQAGAIGPDNVANRIGPAGTSRECVTLRNAVNTMLDKLADGIARERRFASVAAHELRTPLAQLRTQVEVALRKERDVGEYCAALNETLADIDRLQHLVVNLLQLTRTTTPGAIEGRPVPLSAILHKIEKQYPAARFTNRQSAQGIAVMGDEELLRAAIGNILDNAARYAPQEPPSISIEPHERHVELVISDRGPGVPGAERERVFEPLARLDQARTVGEASPTGQTGEGFGLGLTVARSIARAFGGDLICRPRADGQPGAEFVFRFVRNNEHAE